jgi:hypothetical protein
VPDAGQDDEPGTGDRGGGAQQRILRAVQDQGWHAQLGQPAAVRPAQRSRAEITAAAVAIAGREGLDAVSMRRVATELGTGTGRLRLPGGGPARRSRP